MAEKAIPIEAEFTLLKKHMAGLRVRGAARYRCALATLGRLHFPDSGKSTNAWIHNLSESGIGLNIEHCIAVETTLIVCLKSSRASYRLTARVVHATPQADETWRIGCQLIDKLTPEMLDELL